MPSPLPEVFQATAGRPLLANFDGFLPDGSLAGWVLNGSSAGPAADQAPIRVRLCLEDLLSPGSRWHLADLPASQPRPDLEPQGLSHPCGFLLPPGSGFDLPPRSTGLVLRALALVDPPVELPGSPLRVDAHAYRALERISRRGTPPPVGLHPLQGAMLCGWAPAVGALEVRLDGKAIGSVQGDADGRFSLALPPACCDGRPHHLSLWDGDGSCRAESIEITPFQITPWPALLEHGRAPLPLQLSPLAREQHRSLTTWLHWADRDGHPLPADLPLLQRILSSPLEPPAAAAAHEELGPLGTPVSRQPLHLPISGEPRVSIVVPVHNNYAVTRRCLAALAFAPTRVPFEVIVVNDGSHDGTAAFLPAEAPGVTVVSHDYARGFNQACHSGVMAARGEFVVLLNNDTEPCCLWLEELLEPFERWPDTGLTGAQLIYPDGRLQEAGGIVWGNGEPWNYGRGLNPHHPRVAYSRQVDYVSGAALAIRRQLWNQLGGFSPEFSPAYYEDTDLAFKVRQAGFTVRYAALSRVIHHEGLSCGTDADPQVSNGLKRFQTLHAPLFQRKWAEAFAGERQPSFEAAELIKDRGILGRALFLDHGTPRPDRDAGSHAALVEMELVQALGYKVTFLPANLAWLGDYSEALQRRGIELIHAPFVLSLEQFLQERGGEFDLLYLTRYTTVRDSLPLLRRYAPRARVVFCNADLHYLRELRQVQLSGLGGEAAQQAMAAVQETRRQELEAIAGVQLTLTYSEVERAVIDSETLGRAATALCPWVEEVGQAPAPLVSRSGITFLGSYQHPPNRDAVEGFLATVWPQLLERMPDLQFHLYGSGISDELLHSWRSVPGVQVHGWVRSVAEVYERHRVFVAPLRAGAGIKGKVIAGLAHGIPQVLSPVAAEATGVRHGLEAFIASTPEAWCAAVGDLLVNDELWTRTSEAALAHARQHYSRERGLELMATALSGIGLPVSR